MSNDSNKFPSLHDWEIVKVTIDRFSDKVALRFHEPTANRFSDLLFGGVNNIYLSGMTKQNVILDVMIFTKPDNSDYYVRCCELLKETSPFSDKNGVTDKDRKVIYIEPSVGAELVCSFTTMDFIGKTAKPGKEINRVGFD